MNNEFLSSLHLVDILSDWFSFTTVNHKDIDAIGTHHKILNKIYKDLLNNQDTILIIADTSIKNNVAILVSHIQKGHNIVKKCVYHVMNVNYTEAKLFAIRCRIDLVRKLYKALKVVIITNTIPAIKKIFDTLAYLYQLHLIIISKNLREFFNKNPNNLISF